MNRNLKPRLIGRFVVVLVSLVLAGCEPSPARQEANAWIRAETAGTRESLQAFIDEWPDSERVPAARRRLEAVAWRYAIEANTPEQYQSFIDDWQGGIFVPFAEEMLGWINENPDRSIAETNGRLIFALRVNMRTPEKAESARLSYFRATKALLECAGLVIVDQAESEPPDVIIKVDLDGHSVHETYRFPGRDGSGPNDVSIPSGTRLHGTIDWQSAIRPGISKTFQFYDPPPEHAVTFTGEIESLIDSMRYRSVSRSIEARGSYWDQLVGIVLARQGPRSFLCDANWNDTQLAAHWGRALNDDDMPPLGPAVAALFSGQTDRVIAAASRISRSGAPNALDVLERYLEATTEPWMQREREYVLLYIDNLRSRQSGQR